MAYHTTFGPLDPLLLPQFDADYVAYYNSAVLGQPALDYTAEFDPTIRLAYGSSPAFPVGSTRDVQGIGKNPNVRVFTPPGEKPAQGWPVLVYYHGGGWVLGTIESSLSVTTLLCGRCSCVVVSVDYRLAPEHPYPAAVEDAWDVLLWVYEKGKEELGIDPGRIAVGGGSAGGHLAAVVSHLAVMHTPTPIPIAYQLLTVPCTDLDPSPTAYPSRTAYALAPALPAARMLWFYGLFAAQPDEWKASPIRAPDENWSKLGPAFVAVAGMDFLKDEGIAYAEKMRAGGGKVELKVYEGVPHNFAGLALVAKGREFMEDAIERLIAAFAEK